MENNLHAIIVLMEDEAFVRKYDRKRIYTSKLVEGVDPKHEYTFLRLYPGTTGLSVSQFDDNGNPALLVDITYGRQPLAYRRRYYTDIIFMISDEDIKYYFKDCTYIINNSNLPVYGHESWQYQTGANSYIINMAVGGSADPTNLFSTHDYKRRNKNVDKWILKEVIRFEHALIHSDYIIVATDLMLSTNITTQVKKEKTAKYLQPIFEKIKENSKREDSL